MRFPVICLNLCVGFRLNLLHYPLVCLESALNDSFVRLYMWGIKYDTAMH